MITLEEITEINTLNQCAYECSRQSRWKKTTQRYLSNLLVNNIQLRDNILNHRYSVLPTINFIINERGCVRKIESPMMRDRIIQKSIVKNILIPALKPCVIYDNYASLKHRGTTFARKRFEILLKRYVSKFGTNGYILLIDIRKYFESIDHDVLKQLILPKITNCSQDVIDLIYYIIDTSSNSNKGLNLGSEAPQIFAVYYMTPVDIFVKVVKSIKYYGRYMDDIFIIGKTKEELRDLLNQIKEQLSNLKLQINEKKTKIVKLKHGFTFLQVKYNILSTGKILKRISHKKIVRERRRLKAFYTRYKNNKMSNFDIQNCYKSWLGTIIKDHNAYGKTIYNMNLLYCSLFPNCVENTNKGRKQLFANTFKSAETDDLKYIII